MPILTFAGDVHLDKKFPFSTAKTAEDYRKLQALTVSALLEHASPERPTKIPRIGLVQLGDLFDGFTVGGETLIKGFSHAKRMVAVLGGNHDKANNTEKASALDLLRTHLQCPVIWDRPTLLDIKGSSAVIMVPHQLTQEKFEAALAEASQLRHSVQAAYAVLCLHCNFGDREGTQTENYLRRDVAKAMLKDFDLIVSGHEHNHNIPMEGVVMLGSILPCNFGEMEDKVIMEYDTETGAYTLQPIWSREENYKAYRQEDILAGNAPYAQYQFLEVTGTVSIEQAVEVNKWITEAYKSEAVIAVKNSTTLHRHEKEAEAAEKPEDWVSVVREQCNEPQQNLLDEFLREVRR